MKKLRSSKKKVLRVIPFVGIAAAMAFAAVAYACTAYVGQTKVKGNYVNSETVEVIGTDLFDGSDAMTQTVDGHFATSHAATGNGVYIRTAPDPAFASSNNDHRLRWSYDSTRGNSPTGLYGITIHDGIGYTNHTTWNNPSGDCMYWNLGSANVTLLGFVNITSEDGAAGQADAGEIFDATAAADNSAISMTGDGTEMWGPFVWPNEIQTQTDIGGTPRESAVCVGDIAGYSGTGGYNGNQAPFAAV